MPQVKAILSNYRQSPRKVRVVANLIRGKKVSDITNQLGFLAKRPAGPLETLVMSAVANAKNLNIPTEELYVKEIRVDGGQVLKRSMPRARGRAFPIKKRTSHIILVLDTENPKPKKVSSIKLGTSRVTKK